MNHSLDKPLVSIITPTLNSGKFIRDNIKSILTQTYSNIEHIIIDGGSTDNTLSIVREMDPKAVIISEPDEGIADAFNKGIRLANGDIIATLNSDDYYAGNYVIQRVVDAFVSDLDVRAVYGKVRCFDPESGETLFVFGEPFRPVKTRLTSIMSHPAFFVTRDAHQKIGDYSLDYKIAMDQDYFVRTINLYEPYFIDEVLTLMRWGGLSTRNTYIGHKEVYKILRSNRVNIISATANFTYKYIMTFLSLAFQKAGLKSIVLFYRKWKGQL